MACSVPTFGVRVDGAAPVNLSIDFGATDPNNDLDALVADLNAAIAAQSALNGKVVAAKTLDGFLTLTRVKGSSDEKFGFNSSLEIVNPNSVTVNELKLSAGLSTDDLVAARGGYRLVFGAEVGGSTQVSPTSAAYTVDSVNLADQPAAIPVGDIDGDGRADFIASIGNDSSTATLA